MRMRAGSSRGVCLADVIGGPEYQVTLVGEGSTVGFKLDKSSLDFGSVLYTQFKELEFTIYNTRQSRVSVLCDVRCERSGSSGV